MANLPYSISSPFLFKLLENREQMDWAVVMLQKEVALRLLAEPGSKDYSALTVLVAASAEVKPLMKLGADEFHPRPRVDSMLVRVGFQPLPERVERIALLPDFDPALFRRLVNAAFGQRRKTLANSLSSSKILSKQGFAELIAELGLRADIRAERLSVEDFVELSRLLAKKL